MGRSKKYNTKEEKYEAQKRWAMEYYERNKEVSKKKSLERYYRKKNEKNWNI